MNVQITPSFLSSKIYLQNAIVLAPHPDDESIGCGGTIALHVKNNTEVKVIFISSGEEGDLSKEFPNEKNKFAKLRESEAIRACSALGVRETPHFLRFPDGLIKGYVQEAIKLISPIIEDSKPHIIYTTGLFDNHPDHNATGLIAWNLAQLHNCIENILFYEIGQPMRVNTYVDITSVEQLKRNALLEYKSQQMLYDYEGTSLALNRYRSQKVLKPCKYAEAFLGVSTTDLSIGYWSYFKNSHQIENEVYYQNFSNPFFSIIIRTKDRYRLLIDALNSCAAQTYRRFEVIIVNDGGPDISSVVEEYKNYFSCQIVNLDKNFGRSYAANRGLKLAKGDYLNLLDDDDILYPNHLQLMASAINKNQADVFYSNTQHSSTDWNGLNFISNPVRNDAVYNHKKDFVLFDNLLKTNAIVFSKKIFQEVGLFDESLIVHEDWDYWIRLSQKTNFIHVDAITAQVRLVDKKDYQQHFVQILSKHWDKIKPESLANFLANCVDPQIKTLQRENYSLEDKIKNLLKEKKIEPINKVVCDCLDTTQLELNLVKLKSENMELRENIKSISQSISWRSTSFIRKTLDFIKYKPVDVVVTWVDSQDQNWKKKYQDLAKEINVLDRKRFTSRDELRFCLRSIYKHMFWVRNIYILTDGQKPSWLDESHPKIKFVTHQDILEEKYLPVFNSMAIETSIHKIKKLSERFIYFNDDVMILKNMSYKDFFVKDKPICFLDSKLISHTGSVTEDDLPFHSSWKLANILFDNWEKKTSQRHCVSHGPSAHTKKRCTLVNQKLKNEVEITKFSKFRTNKCWSWTNCLYPYYSIIFGREFGQFEGQTAWSLTDHMDMNEEHFLQIKKEYPRFFCLQDETTSDSPFIKDQLIRFLTELYPHPSPWEKF